MSNENQTPTATPESAQPTDKVSPFLTEPLPQGAPQGQQQSLEQKLTDTPVTGSVPKYNLPRGANTGNVGATTHTSATKPSAVKIKPRKSQKSSTRLQANTTL